jgi:hypothetical protein
MNTAKQKMAVSNEVNLRLRLAIEELQSALRWNNELDLVSTEGYIGHAQKALTSAQLEISKFATKHGESAKRNLPKDISFS